MPVRPIPAVGDRVGHQGQSWETAALECVERREVAGEPYVALVLQYLTGSRLQFWPGRVGRVV